MLPKRGRLPGDHGALTCCRVRTCQGMSCLNMEKTQFNEELIGINEELISIWCLISISRDPTYNQEIIRIWRFIVS